MKFSENETLDVLYRRIEEDPDGYEANLKLGLLLSSIRKFLLQGEPFLVKALSHGIKDEGTSLLFDRLGHIYTVKGLFDQVVEIYLMACELLPEAPAFRFRLGDALFRVGKVEESSAIYHEAVEKIYQTAKYYSFRRNEPIVHLLAPHKVICRYLGEMAAKLDLYLKARELGYLEVDNPILFAPRSETVNQSLIDYWGDHVQVVSDEREIEECQQKYPENWVYLDYFTIPDGRTLHRDIAHRVIQKQWEKENRTSLLKLSPVHHQRGWRILREQGVPGDAWFVCLHVREAGFFDEDVSWSNNRHRNADIMDYIPAILSITERGGWVVRIGDPSMTPLPAMRQVIDYANSDFRDDWMDLFCVAESRFFLGMASGPSSVAVAFGVPSLGTNWFPLGPWPYGKDDIFIHKLLKSMQDGRILGIVESLKAPFFGAMEPLFFEARGVEPVDNSPREISEAVIEMLDRLDGKLTYSEESNRLQDRYRALADPYGVGLGSRVARTFLQRHPELIAGSGEQTAAGG